MTLPLPRRPPLMNSRAICRFSSTVRLRNTLYSCGTYDMPAFTRWGALKSFRRAPASTISPCRAGSRPASVLISVDLPEPFGPMTVTIARSSSAEIDAFQDVAFAVAGVQLVHCEDRAHATAPTLPRYACITSRLDTTSLNVPDVSVRPSAST